MLMAVDIGTSNTKTLLFSDKAIPPVRTAENSLVLSSPDGLRDFLKRITSDIIGPDTIQDIYISSVAPKRNSEFLNAFKNVLNIEPVFLTCNDFPFMIKVDKPAEVGVDRLANTLAAVREYGPPCISIDCGTAVTIDVADKAGDFIGGMIIPNLKAGLDDLLDRAPHLPEIEIEKIGTFLGKNTGECIKIGTYKSIIGILEYNIQGLIKELGLPEGLPVILTGGWADLVNDDLSGNVIHDPLLTFKGIFEVYKHKKGN
jgi:type III pantothenate kinase